MQDFEERPLIGMYREDKIFPVKKRFYEMGILLTGRVNVNKC